MSYWHEKYIKLLLVVALSHLLLLPAWAANPCALPHLQQFNEGIGGTGLKPVREEGMGGTGHFDVQDGIGGTGYSEGLGGTGAPVVSNRVTVVGVITGFASICVNGLEIQVAPETRLLIDGSPASVDALRVGQIVSVEAIERQGMLTAVDLDVRHEVIGTIEAVDRVAGVARVMGQQLQLNAKVAGLDHGQLVPGDVVKVSGFRGNHGEILVTRMEQIAGKVEQLPTTSRVSVELPGKLGVLQGVVEKAEENQVQLVGWPAMKLPAGSIGREKIDVGDVVMVAVDERGRGQSGIIGMERFEDELLHERAGMPIVDHEKHFGETRFMGQPESDDEKPEIPEIKEQEPPEYEESELPEVSEYEESESPEMPEYDAPELPEAPEYEAPELPEALEYEAPELPEVPEYETPELPEVPEFEAPELPEVPEYEAPELPEVPEFEAPELPEVPEYEAPELPEVPEYEAPELPEVPEFEAPELPEVPEYEKPEIEPPELPETGY